MQKLTSIVRRAIDDFAMIDSGDKIAVGVSGGKDSLALLCALAKLREYYPHPFELLAVTADAGFAGMDFSPLGQLCQTLNIPYIIHPTDIKAIVFDYRQESNPCSLCARMRRGALHDIAVANGCNKVALGHTRDDVSETFLMSLLYEGRLNTFSPVTYLSRKNLHVIRPLIYTGESQIISVVKKLKLPVVHSTCPVNGGTKRAYVDELITQLQQQTGCAKTNLFGAIKRSGLWGWNAQTDRPLPPAGQPDSQR